MDAERIFLQCDSSEPKKSYLVALDKKSGKIVWRVDRVVDMTWSTPIPADGALVTAATEMVIAYDPKTGRQLWTGPGGVSAGYPEKYAYAAGKDGRVLWSKAHVPSPSLYGPFVYLMTDKGLLTCIDAKPGEVKYEGKRPRGAGYVSLVSGCV